MVTTPEPIPPSKEAKHQLNKKRTGKPVLFFDGKVGQKWSWNGGKTGKIGRNVNLINITRKWGCKAERRML
jgi:hypothetical protein